MNLKTAIKTLIVGSGAPKLLYKYRGPSITILRYHSVQNNPKDHESTIGSSIIHSTDDFYKQISILSRHYSPISMDDVLRYLEDGVQLPPYPVVITFDDGYKDNIDIAAPILDEFNIPATFYVIVDSLASQENQSAWFFRVRNAFSKTTKSSWIDSEGNVYSLSDIEKRTEARGVAMAYCGSSIGKIQLERVAGIEQALEVPGFEAGLEMMLTWNDLRALRDNGHIIGSHTMSHPNLAYVREEDAKFEMEQSKIELENKLGESIKHFAYPNPILNPNWNKKTYELSKSIGYKTAVTCDYGRVKFGDDPLALKRMFAPKNPDELRWYIENAMNGFKL